MDTLKKPNNDKLQDNDKIIDAASAELTTKAEKVVISDDNPLLTNDEASKATAIETDAPVKKVRKKKEDVEEKAESKTQEEDPKTPAVKRAKKKKEEPSSEKTSSDPSQNIQKPEDKTPLIDSAEAEKWDIKMLVEKAEEILGHDRFDKIRESMKLLIRRHDVLKKEYEQNLPINEPKDSEIEELEQEPSEQDEFLKLSDRFKSIQSNYTKLRKEYLEKLEAEKLRNYELKKQILEDLKVLVDSEETLQKSWEDFKQLQLEWKNIGQVPPAQNQDLWNSFNHLVDLFLDKVKINRELRDLDCKKNLESKIEICEKIEELLLVESMDVAFRMLRDLQTQWRETGPVPSEKREEINSRFANIIERLKEKRKEQYDSFKEKLEENLELKRALIVQMKQIAEQEIGRASCRERV